MSADTLARARRIAVKVGSALLIDPATGAPDAKRFNAIAGDIAAFNGRGTRAVLISSGAVALGRAGLQAVGRPLRLEEKQAAAALGQIRLIAAWERALAAHGLAAAQALISPPDTEDRRRWLNARATLETLLAAGAIPIVNENDTVATEELRYGDNDRLAARIAQMIGAEALILLSDVDGLYEADPRQRPQARLIAHVPAITPKIEALAGPPGVHGSGGMATKLAAAKIAAQAGCATVIAKGAADRPLQRLLDGARATWFDPALDPASAKRAWIAGALNPAGALGLDAGAEAAVRAGKSLLPAGITAVEGRFSRGDAVRLLNPKGAAFAVGLCAYDDTECRAITGLRSDAIEARLGYRRGAAVVHASDIVLQTP